MAQSVPTTLPNPFHSFPSTPTVDVTPFRVDFPQEKLDDLRRRIDDAPEPRKTFENSTTDEQLGITRDWLTHAVAQWKKHDWRKTEEEINSFPNYKAKLEHKGHSHDVHFIALFSKKKDAVPIVMTHGWPGSVLEFIPLLHHLSGTFTPDDLPVHIIVPSLIGYGFSSPPPIDDDFTTGDNAALFDQLMRGLGFEQYVAQGGDVGSLVSTYLGADYPACKAIHLNMIMGETTSPDELDLDSMDDFDKSCVARWKDFTAWEFAYKHEHSTKTATISFVLESSPIALLSWIGEKFLVWSDHNPPLDVILANVTLYWLTNSISTSLYHYRTSAGRRAAETFKRPDLANTKVGYSLFKKEIHPIPKIVAEKMCNLVWFEKHEEGGHFAALEQPQVLWGDVKSFIDKVW